MFTEVRGGPKASGERVQPSKTQEAFDQLVLITSSGVRIYLQTLASSSACAPSEVPSS